MPRRGCRNKNGDQELTYRVNRKLRCRGIADSNRAPRQTCFGIPSWHLVAAALGSGRIVAVTRRLPASVTQAPVGAKRALEGACSESTCRTCSSGISSTQAPMARHRVSASMGWCCSSILWSRPRSLVTSRGAAMTGRNGSPKYSMRTSRASSTSPSRTAAIRSESTAMPSLSRGTRQRAVRVGLPRDCCGCRSAGIA